MNLVIRNGTRNQVLKVPQSGLLQIIIEIMKTRKPRTKEQKRHYEDTHFGYDIETDCKEFFNPWSHQSYEIINKWQHLLMQFMASLSEKKRQEFIENEQSK